MERLLVVVFDTGERRLTACGHPLDESGQQVGRNIKY